ncbi:hypothetical protein HYDPIDRAFT_33099, partial [Hydnomerulius pinastri MD-312]
LYVPNNGDDLEFLPWPKDVVDVYKRGGPLAEAIPLVKSRSGSDRVKQVLLTRTRKRTPTDDAPPESMPGPNAWRAHFLCITPCLKTTEAPHLCPTATAAPPHALALLNAIAPPPRPRPRSPQRHRSPSRPRSPQCPHSPERPYDRPPPPSRQKRGRGDEDIDSDEFEEDEGDNTRRLPQPKRARGPPQGHVDQGRGDRSDSTNDYDRPREAGHRGRKERHRERAGRHYSPTRSESSDIEIVDVHPAKHSKMRARDPSSSPAPARYGQYDNDRDASPRPSRHRKHDRPRAPSASPSRQDTSHGKNARRHNKKRGDEEYRQEWRVRGDRY